MSKKKRIAKFGVCFALVCATTAVGCGKQSDEEIKLTVWVSEADQPFAKEIADKFQKANEGKRYRFFQLMVYNTRTTVHTFGGFLWKTRNTLA